MTALGRGAHERSHEIDVLLQVSLDPPGREGRAGADASDLPGLAAARERLEALLPLTPEVVHLFFKLGYPVANAPATMTGRGLHFTEAGYVDVWQWKATSGGPTGWMDDAHFGPPLEPTPTQAANVIPYKGGFAPDPGSANYRDNFTVDAETTDSGRASPLDI